MCAMVRSDVAWDLWRGRLPVIVNADTLLATG